MPKTNGALCMRSRDRTGHVARVAVWEQKGEKTPWPHGARMSVVDVVRHTPIKFVVSN